MYLPVTWGNKPALKVAERAFLDWLQVGCIVVFVKDKLAIFIGEDGNATGVLFDIPEVRVVQA